MEDFEIKEYKINTQEDGSLWASRDNSLFMFKIVWRKKIANPHSKHFGKNQYTFLWSYDLPQERDFFQENNGLGEDWQQYNGIKRLRQYLAKNRTEVKEVVIFKNHQTYPIGEVKFNALPSLEEERRAYKEKQTQETEEKPKPSKKARERAEPSDPELLYSQALISLEKNEALQHIPHEELKRMAKLYVDDKSQFNQIIKEITMKMKDVAPG